MKILIVGAGLSGISLARLLKDRKHDVSIIEKNKRLGGLCITDVDRHGLKYEPFGARTFHSSNPKVIKFAQKFGEFNGYTHRKGMLINGQLFPFPITRKAIKKLPEAEQIFRELQDRPPEIDKTNFETACISIFGKILYNYFIKNYTERMWGMKATKMLADWAPKRLELREDESDELFVNQWQGLPSDGYSVWLENMSKGIPIKFECTEYNNKDYDVVVFTGQIDWLVNYKFGKLKYRSFTYDYVEDEKWEYKKYGTINLPQHSKYVRKCNFKILHKQESVHSIIQYQKPAKMLGNNPPMYPISTSQNHALFDRYLMEVCDTWNICPTGRLALYKYLDMDRAIETSMNMISIIEDYMHMDKKERYRKIQEVRNNVYKK